MKSTVGRWVLLCLALAAQPAAAQEARRVLAARDVDPGATFAELAESTALESIQRLERLLAQSDLPDDTRAEATVRLADLFFQQGRREFLREMRDHEAATAACDADPTCDASALRPDNRGSARWNAKAVTAYRDVLAAFPRHARADQATYFLGAALADLGRADEALEAFKRVVKLHPASSFAPDAWVWIGEAYFDRNEAYPALVAYQRATTFTDSPRYAFAMYKLAWCYYNVGDLPKAIATLEVVVGHDAQVELRDEGFADLVRFLADAGDVEQGYAILVRLGRRDLIRPMLERLARAWTEQGRYDEAITTWRRLISETPDAAQRPAFQAEIVACYRKLGDAGRALDEVEAMLRDHGPSAALEEELRRLAVDLHLQTRKLAQGRHTDATRTGALAHRAYAAYLEAFPTDPHAYDVRYGFGELLYQAGAFEAAYDQYLAVVALDPAGKHSRFCAESAIFAAERRLAAEPRPDAGAAGPLPLSDAAQDLVTAAAQFARLFPADPKASEAAYKAGYTLYHHHRFEEAAAQFRVVIAREPRSADAEAAANLILDSLVVRGNWQALLDNARFYRDSPGLGSARFKREVGGVVERASFKVIEVDLQADGDRSRAAERFEAFVQEFPESDTAALALNNAAVYYASAGRLDDAMRVRTVLVDDPRFGEKTKYYADQLAALAFDWEALAEFERAAALYERLWEAWPRLRAAAPPSSDGAVREAIYTAALFRDALGQPDASLIDHDRFAATFPDDPRVADVRLRAANLAARAGRLDEAVRRYQAFLAEPPASATEDHGFVARLHLARALGELGRDREQAALWDETIARHHDGLGIVATEVVAELGFERARRLLERYEALEIRGAGPEAGRAAEDRALAESLGRKARALVEVEAACTAVVQLGAGEWGIAALVAIGRAHEDMADALRRSDVPFYLAGAPRDAYEEALGDRAWVQDEQAVNAYELALDKAFELTIYDDATAWATRRLGALRPDEHPGLHELVLAPRYQAVRAEVYGFERSL